jgi:hypothetical protein
VVNTSASCPARRPSFKASVARAFQARAPSRGGDVLGLLHTPLSAASPRPQRWGGFPSQAAATRARDDVLDQSLERFTGQRWTVERWLRYWLTTRTSIRPTTLRVYTQHIEQCLIPRLGKLRLADVTVRHLTAMFADLAKQTARTGEPLASATLHRICATLRGALNAAIRNDLITDNPARRIELPSRPRPHAVVWTPERVEQWQQRGVRDKVAVWTAEHLATFLDRVVADRLYALWWLIALRGLRRGEAAGLRWCDVDLQRGTATIVQQITAPAGGSTSGRRRAQPAAGSSPWTGSASNGEPPGGGGRTLATSSPVPTGSRCTRTTSPTGSTGCASSPNCRRSGSMTSDTAPRPWPTRPAPISRPSRISLATPASS